jgi:RNA polymerase sigma-70 factor, ECF subfamily
VQAPAGLRDEQALIERAKRQDTEAFRVLYRHYFPRVYAYVAYRVAREEDIEDIVANVFGKLVQRLNQFEYRQEGAFAAWLFTIAYNQVADFYRNKKRLDSNISPDKLPDIQSNTLTPEQMTVRQERFRQLYQRIRTLSPRRQEVIILSFFGGLRNKEIAKVLQLNERTVSSHLSQALEDLRRKYVGLSEEGVDG